MRLSWSDVTYQVDILGPTEPQGLTIQNCNPQCHTPLATFYRFLGTWPLRNNGSIFSLFPCRPEGDLKCHTWSALPVLSAWPSGRVHFICSFLILEMGFFWHLMHFHWWTFHTSSIQFKEGGTQASENEAGNKTALRMYCIVRHMVPENNVPCTYHCLHVLTILVEDS